MHQDNKLCTTPNQHARPASMEITDDGVLIHGYQEFYLDRKHIHPLAKDHALQKKVGLLSSFFLPRYLKEKTFLDLGVNAAYFCFSELHEGAAKVTAIDIDDVVIALAFIYWLYSATTLFGSLTASIAKLAELTNVMCREIQRLNTVFEYYQTPSPFLDLA